MNQSDQIESIAGILWRLHAGPDGAAVRLRRSAHGGDPGRVAKACGIPPQMLTAWERGTVRPTTQQTLTWLSFLYDSSPVRDPAQQAERAREEAHLEAEERRAARRKRAASAGPGTFTVDLGRLPATDRAATAGQLVDTAKRSSSSVLHFEVYAPVVTALAEAATLGEPAAVDVGELDVDDRKELGRVLAATADRAARNGNPGAVDGMRLLSAAWEKFTYGPDGEPPGQRRPPRWAG